MSPFRPERLVEAFEEGWDFEKTPLTEAFGLEHVFAEHGEEAKPSSSCSRAAA
jgi:hypothetical protein